MTRGSRIGRRLLFGLVLVSLPVMMYVRESDREPYPALFMPAFDGLSMRGNQFVQVQPVVTALDASGQRHRIELNELFDAPDVESSHLLGLTRSVLGDLGRMTSASAVAYLQGRLSELGIHDADTLQVTWYQVATSPDDLRTARRTSTVRSYTVELGR